MLNNTEKQKALSEALSRIEKQYGKGSIMRLGENGGMNVEVIPTGILPWILQPAWADFPEAV